jgi:hypothetical protein
MTGEAQPLTEGDVAALLRERDAYARTGRPERADQVVAYLKSRGWQEPAAEDPRKQPPQGRSARPRTQQTADD